MWEIRWTKEFEGWILSDEADAAIREDARAALKVLAEFGPALGRPLVDTVKGSRHPNMKELRVQSRGRPIRIFFAFDPERRAILLVGGDKHGRKRFYETSLAIADRLFDEYLAEIKYERTKIQRRLSDD
jgi:hypothetical protein